MRKKTLVLKFDKQDYEYRFEDKVFVIEDKKLVENLLKPNIKNQEATLFIKSEGDIHISDVVQLKVNVGEAETMMSVQCKFFFIELEFT